MYGQIKMVICMAGNKSKLMLINLIVSLIKNSFLALVILLAIGMFQVMFIIRGDFERVHISVGLPFDYFYFSRDTEIRVYSFNFVNLIFDFLIYLMFMIVFNKLLSMVKNQISDLER